MPGGRLRRTSLYFKVSFFCYVYVGWAEDLLTVCHASGVWCDSYRCVRNIKLPLRRFVAGYVCHLGDFIEACALSNVLSMFSASVGYDLLCKDSLWVGRRLPASTLRIFPWLRSGSLSVTWLEQVCVAGSFAFPMWSLHLR